MTTRQERALVLQGKDAMVNAVIAYFAEHGWTGELLLKNVTCKVYSPNDATVRVEFDSEGQQYWVTSIYVSQGENILSGCILCIKASTSAEELRSKLDAYLSEIEEKINQSFAVRFLGNGAVSSR